MAAALEIHAKAGKYIDWYVQKQNTKDLETETKWLNKTNIIKICQSLC